MAAKQPWTIQPSRPALQAVLIGRHAHAFANFLSWVILTDLLAADGLVNQMLQAFGLNPVNFLGSPSVFPWTMIISDIWKGFGFGTVVYLAALTSIDPELYEAARIDGGGKLAQTRFITLPMLAPTIVLMLVLSLGSVLNAGFDQIYNLYAPVVYDTGDIIDTYVYRLGITQAQYSVGTAVGLFKSVISMILPGALPVYNMVILMNFIRGLPDELQEAARIDGASEFQLLYKVMIPLLKPALATVGLFCIVGHWNDWFSGVIYLNDRVKYPLATYMQSLLRSFESLMRQAGSDYRQLASQINVRTGRAAQLFLGALPVMLVYPFLQKYFTTGLTLGSVKG
nr:ABC transporter permease subunit [uncultured Acetatifactor sp.]